MTELDRVREERDQFLEQLAMRQPSAMERDMQEIMRINNMLLGVVTDALSWWNLHRPPTHTGTLPTWVVDAEHIVKRDPS